MFPTVIAHGSSLSGLLFASKAWSYVFDLYLLLFGYNGGYQIFMYDMYNPGAGVVQQTFSGAFPYGPYGAGVAWCPWATCFILLSCTSANYTGADETLTPMAEVFRITPSWTGGTWTGVRVPIQGAVGYTATFVGKRIFADVTDQTVNWVSSYDGDVYSLKVS